MVSLPKPPCRRVPRITVPGTVTKRSVRRNVSLPASLSCISAWSGARDRPSRYPVGRCVSVPHDGDKIAADAALYGSIKPSRSGAIAASTALPPFQDIVAI